MPCNDVKTMKNAECKMQNAKYSGGLSLFFALQKGGGTIANGNGGWYKVKENYKLYPPPKANAFGPPP